MLDFFLQDETESKWRAVEILMSSLYHGKDAPVNKHLLYGHLTLMWKFILQSTDLNEAKHISLNKFSVLSLAKSQQ